MAVMSRMLPLVAFSTFAILVLALLATPTNALSNQPHAHVARGHDSIAKRKRSAVKRAKRCRPKTSTLAASTTSPATAAPANTEAASSYAPTTDAPSTTPAPQTTKAATTSVAAITSVSSGGGTSSGNGKLLLAWPNDPSNLAKFIGKNVVNMYTWSPYCPAAAKTLGISCSPMLWGTKQKSVFAQQVKGDNPGMIFGFNEPNESTQANMSPQDAAGLWAEMVRPLQYKGYQLVSPATTSAPTGKKWLQDMQAACGGDCGFSYIALHWYGTSIDEFKAYVDDWYKTFGKPLIISEYACQNFSGGAQCSKDQTLNFHYTMGKWFDQHPGVHQYAPFGFMADMYNVNYDNQLMASNGGPNELGSWYIWHD